MFINAYKYICLLKNNNIYIYLNLLFKNNSYGYDYINYYLIKIDSVKYE